MCELTSSRALSRLGVACGALSLATLLTAFVSSVWLFTREPVRLPNSDQATSITFRIGLWRVCPTVNKTNVSQHLPSPACSLIKYSNWDDVKHSDLGVWTTLDFTPAFITRMRLSTPFEAVSLVLMLLATMFAIAGHCSGDHKTLVAVGLYIMGGLSLGGGLVIFACVLSDTYLERPRRPTAFLGSSSLAFQLPASSHFDYQYGWSFFAAGGAVILAEVAALLCVTAYLRRFPTLEDMVRAVVPGAERAMRQGAAASQLLRPQRPHNLHPQHHHSHRRQNGPPKVFGAAKPRALDAADLEGAEGPLLSNTAPDICSANPAKSDLTEDGAAAAPAAAVTTDLGQQHEGPLAGVTVPITLMRPPPAGASRPVRKADEALLPPPTPTPFLYAQQLGMFGGGTLVHQGVLGVSEGGTSTSSSSSAGTGSHFSTLQPRKTRGVVNVSTFSTMDAFEEARAGTWSNSEV